MLRQLRGTEAPQADRDFALLSVEGFRVCTGCDDGQVTGHEADQSAAYQGACAEPVPWETLEAIFDQLCGADRRELPTFPQVIGSASAEWIDSSGARHVADDLDDLHRAYDAETTSIITIVALSGVLSDAWFEYRLGSRPPHACASMRGSADAVARAHDVIRDAFPLPYGGHTVRGSKVFVLDQSLMSYRIETYCEGSMVSRATGFVVTDGANQQPFLITNRHVVRGRHNETDESLGDRRWPTELSVHWPTANYGTQETRSDLLDSGGLPLWRIHPGDTTGPGSQVDIAAIAIDQFPDSVDVMPYDLQAAEPPMYTPPSSDVYIIGYPFGYTGTGRADAPSAWSIWVRATIASEVGFGWDGLPMFLVDCRGRSGLSGSPVIAHSVDGQYAMATETGPMSIVGVAPSHRLLGVYSGRLYGTREEESDLGMVWTADALRDLIRFGQREPSR